MIVTVDAYIFIEKVKGTTITMFTIEPGLLILW